MLTFHPTIFGITLLGRFELLLPSTADIPFALSWEITPGFTHEGYLRGKQMAFRGRHNQDTAKNVCEEQ